MYEFVEDGIQLGLDALLALGFLLVDGMVDTQQVGRGAVISGSISFFCTRSRNKMILMYKTIRNGSPPLL